MTTSIRGTRTVHDIKCWLTDMDGVLVHENQAIKGAAELLGYWRENNLRFLVLTNNSIFTPRDLRARLLASGLDAKHRAAFRSILRAYGAAMCFDDAPANRQAEACARGAGRLSSIELVEDDLLFSGADAGSFIDDVEQE